MSSPSSQATISDLLHEVTDAVEPGDRLDAIRAATAGGGRRPHRGWWAAGGAGLVAASVVTALALTTGGAPRGGPGPAEESTATTDTTVIDPEPAGTLAVPVYFVGDTPSGPRLYREFQSGAEPEVASSIALEAALRGLARDPDYRSLWPADASVGAVLMASDLITITLIGDLHDRPAGMTESDARLAIEQVVRTAQGVYGQGRIPVQLLLNDARTDQVLGVPASEPLAAGSDLEVLAHVSISNPSEGLLVDNDQPLTVDGVGRSEDGRVALRLTRGGGRDAVAYLEPDLEPTDAPLAPFSVRLLRDDLQPGDYDVVVTVTNADGTFDTDTRRITIVD